MSKNKLEEMLDQLVRLYDEEEDGLRGLASDSIHTVLDEFKVWCISQHTDAMTSAYMRMVEFCAELESAPKSPAGEAAPSPRQCSGGEGGGCDEK